MPGLNFATSKLSAPHDAFGHFMAVGADEPKPRMSHIEAKSDVAAHFHANLQDAAGRSIDGLSHGATSHAPGLHNDK